MIVTKVVRRAKRVREMDLFIQFHSHSFHFMISHVPEPAEGRAFRNDQNIRNAIWWRIANPDAL